MKSPKHTIELYQNLPLELKFSEYLLITGIPIKIDVDCGSEIPDAGKLLIVGGCAICMSGLRVP